MRTWLQTLQRGVKYRVTRGGFLFILAVTLIAAAAVASANNLLFLVVATMLSVLLVSGLVSRLGLDGLEAHYRGRGHELPERLTRASIPASFLNILTRLFKPRGQLIVKGQEW